MSKTKSLDEIAREINGYLSKFEKDPEVNTAVEGQKIFYFSNAHRSRKSRKISIIYVSYHTATMLDREAAGRYLTALRRGFVGQHWHCKNEEIDDDLLDDGASKTKRSGAVLWRAYHDFNKWVLQSQGVEMTDKMVYFDRGKSGRESNKFSDYNYQKPIDEVNRTYGRTPQEARDLAIGAIVRERDALLERVDKLNQDIETVQALRDPIEGMTARSIELLQEEFEEQFFGGKRGNGQR